MKIRIDVDPELKEDEVVIHCQEMDPTIQKLQQVILQTSQKSNFVFYKNHVEYYFPLDCILFFETSANGIDAHTLDDVFQIKYKLYELETILPSQFVRVSKSTILNIRHIYSIDKNLTSSSVVQFNKTYKQVYVSRNYYKMLKQRLDERRNYEI